MRLGSHAYARRKLHKGRHVACRGLTNILALAQSVGAEQSLSAPRLRLNLGQNIMNHGNTTLTFLDNTSSCRRARERLRICPRAPGRIPPKCAVNSEDTANWGTELERDPGHIIHTKHFNILLLSTTRGTSDAFLSS